MTLNRIKLDFVIMKRLKGLVIYVALVLPMISLATDSVWGNDGTVVVGPNVVCRATAPLAPINPLTTISGATCRSANVQTATP